MHFVVALCFGNILTDEEEHEERLEGVLASYHVAKQPIYEFNSI